MKRASVLARCLGNVPSAAERAHLVRVPTGPRAVAKGSWLILFFSLLLGCAGVTDEDLSSSESESMINEGAVLGGVSVLDHGDLIDQLGCDAYYAVMAPVKDEQADACEAGLGAISCSERPAGLSAYVMSQSLQLVRKASMTVVAKG